MLRDELGRVIDGENKVIPEKEKSLSIPDWQDPQLLKDIQVTILFSVVLMRVGVLYCF